MKSLQLYNTVLRPGYIPKHATDLEGHGEAELRKLCDMYGNESGFINTERAGYFQVKVILKSVNMSLADACSYILNDYRDVFPDFVKLASIVLVSPVTYVTFERGFSVQNKIKTKGRSCLKHNTITKLMRVIEEGLENEAFHPRPACQLLMCI